MDNIKVVSERMAAVIPDRWLQDFFALIEGEEPALEFVALFELNEVWQDVAEEAIRAIDSPGFISLIRSATGAVTSVAANQ